MTEHNTMRKSQRNLDKQRDNHFSSVYAKRKYICKLHIHNPISEQPEYIIGFKHVKCNFPFKYKTDLLGFQDFCKFFDIGIEEEVTYSGAMS